MHPAAVCLAGLIEVERSFSNTLSTKKRQTSWKANLIKLSIFVFVTSRSVEGKIKIIFYLTSLLCVAFSIVRRQTALLQLNIWSLQCLFVSKLDEVSRMFNLRGESVITSFYVFKATYSCCKPSETHAVFGQAVKLMQKNGQRCRLESPVRLSMKNSNSGSTCDITFLISWLDDFTAALY